MGLMTPLVYDGLHIGTGVVVRLHLSLALLPFVLLPLTCYSVRDQSPEHVRRVLTPTSITHYHRGANAALPHPQEELAAGGTSYLPPAMRATVIARRGKEECRAAISAFGNVRPIPLAAR